jgi:hypothetical protein
MAEPSLWRPEHNLPLTVSSLVGRYRLDVVAGRWWWSDDTYRIHGFEPGEVVPTTELIMAHKHPDDRVQLGAILERSCITGEAFGTVHLSMDAHGRRRTLSVVGHGVKEPDTSAVREIAGFVTDITPAISRSAGLQATEQIRASTANRATIEQAKAIIMCAIGTNDDGAFRWLKEASHHTNVPLRDIAQEIVDAARSQDGDMQAVTEALAAVRTRRPPPSTTSR